MVGSKVRGVRRVKIRFVPKDDESTTSLFDEFIPGDVSPRASPEPEEDHDHNHDHEHTHSNGKENGKKTQ